MAWDPDADKHANASAPSKDALARITLDLQKCCAEPLPNVLVIPSADVRRVKAIIIGPDDTPYTDAPFLFTVLFPNNYPFSPPKVKLLTTGGGTVRMGPNLYADGKVCLSILGTWEGPSWLPCHNLGTVLLSIQSLLSRDPARNEPGHEAAPHAEVLALNNVLAHEVLRVACLGQMKAARESAEGARAPVFDADVRDALAEHFAIAAETLAERAARLAPALDGTPFAEPAYAQVTARGVFGAPRFQFAELARQLEREAALLEAADGAAGAAAGGGGGGK